jgi:hypothetical protein
MTLYFLTNFIVSYMYLYRRLVSIRSLPKYFSLLLSLSVVEISC